MTSRQVKLQEDIYARVMRNAQVDPDITQRELAAKLGVRVAWLNYCVKALIEKESVKVRNFADSKKEIWMHSRTHPKWRDHKGHNH